MVLFNLSKISKNDIALIDVSRQKKKLQLSTFVSAVEKY